MSLEFDTFLFLFLVFSLPFSSRQIRLSGLAGLLRILPTGRLTLGNYQRWFGQAMQSSFNWDEILIDYYRTKIAQGRWSEKAKSEKVLWTPPATSDIKPVASSCRPRAVICFVGESGLPPGAITLPGAGGEKTKSI